MARVGAHVRPVVAAAPRRTALGALRRSESFYAFLLVFPTLLVVLGVTAYPWAYSVWLSLHNYNAAVPEKFDFVGLANYTKFINDPIFRESFVHTLHYAFLTVVGASVIGLGMALVLNERFAGRGFVRSALLVPWAMSLVVVALLWRWIFDGTYGTLNGLLASFGLIHDYVAWMGIGGGSAAIYIVAVAFVWNQAPLAALLFLAGLQAIPPNLYSSAKVDGANAIQRFWKITLPWMRSMGLLVLIILTVGSPGTELEFAL